MSNGVCMVHCPWLMAHGSWLMAHFLQTDGRNPMEMKHATQAVAESAPIVVSNQQRWTIVWRLFLASLINYFDRQTLSFAMPLIAKDFQLDETQQGLLLSAFFWTYTYLQIPIGFCVDRFNLRWLYAGAFVLWSVAQGLTGLAGSIA